MGREIGARTLVSEIGQSVDLREAISHMDRLLKRRPGRE
jgi:hypothetical protein